MDDRRYLLNLIQVGEHQQQDFKYRVTDACKLAKSVSARLIRFGTAQWEYTDLQFLFSLA